MKIEGAKSLINLIRNSTLYELFFVSIIVLPICLGSWTIVLKELGLMTNGSGVLSILLLFYILTLGIMKFYQSKEDEIPQKSIRIRSYIISRKWTRMSFDRINKSIDHSFDDQLLNKIIEKYPEDFRVGTVKSGKKALVILGEEEEA